MPDADPARGVPSGLLNRYALATHARGSTRGERTSRQAGSSLDYLDDRPYQPGDDPRAVDWRAYARTGRLTTRLYQAERAADVHLLIDDSPSMQLYAKHRWVNAIARILTGASRHEGSLRFHRLSGTSSPPRQGHAIPHNAVDTFLATSRTETTADGNLPNAIARHALALPSHPGAALLIVLSDFLDPHSLQPALRAARARRLDLLLLATLAHDERHPTPTSAELHDVETGNRIDVDADDVRRYRQALNEHEALLLRQTRDAGHRYVPLTAPPELTEITPSDASLERTAFHALVKRGILRRR